MTEQTRKFTEKLLGDLRANPEIAPWSAAQAVLLGSIKLKMALEEAREVLMVIRMEYGIERKQWAGMIVELIRAMPSEYKQGHFDRTIHWDS
jgi:hypothetical protein